MAVQVVEFSKGGYKIRKFLPKKQHSPRKLLNFENWVNGGLRSFQKIRVLKVNYFHLFRKKIPQIEIMA